MLTGNKMRGHVAGDQTLNVLLKIVMGLAFKPCITPVYKPQLCSASRFNPNLCL